ncbi:hypothetical protein FHG87_010408 [Trinorchestia longiramus]|nr:hypothetical protein FHG87_010408 [Trinorchestia longiramus]
MTQRSQPVFLNFVPGVVLNGSSSVSLSASSPSDRSTVLVGPLAALSQLLVDSNSSSVTAKLEDVKASAALGMSERRLVVEATGGVRKDEGSNAMLSVKSPLTRQIFSVHVVLEGSLEGVCPAPSMPLLQLLLVTLTYYHTHLFAVLCVVLTAAAAAVGYQAWCGPGYRNTSAGVFANSPPPPPTASPLLDTSPFLSRSSTRDARNISLWSSDSVYGAPPSPPSLLRSPRPLSPM